MFKRHRASPAASLKIDAMWMRLIPSFAIWQMLWLIPIFLFGVAWQVLFGRLGITVGSIAWIGINVWFLWPAYIERRRILEEDAAEPSS